VHRRAPELLDVATQDPDASVARQAKTVLLDSTYTPVARDPDHLDLFVTGTDGEIYSIYWDDASGWPNSWFRL
jgi:hypothetical protein